MRLGRTSGFGRRTPITCLLFFAAVVVASGCSDSGLCDEADLRARLMSATSGQTVRVGECALLGPFDVPAGVTLEGAGLATSIRAPADGRALTLTPSTDASTPTSAVGLSLLSPDGCAAVVANGAGAVSLSNVTLRVDSGVGIAVEGATSVSIRDVVATGPITAESASTTSPPLPPFSCGSGSTATHGIVLVDVASARVESSETNGFGRFGLLAVRGATDLSAFSAENNLGAGVEVWAGTASLDSVTVEGTSDGSGAIEAYGVVFGGGADATSTDLSVTGGDGYGVFHDDAIATHDGLIASDNGFAGAWAQNTTGFSLVGETTDIRRNAFAGVAILDSMGALLEDAAIGQTAFGTVISGVSTIRGADGVHVSSSNVTLSRLMIRDNARVGAVVDLDGSTTGDVTLTDVTVEAGGMALGVVAQNGMLVAGWDDGVTRLGSAAVNDMAFAGALDIAEGVGPPCLPPLDALDVGGIGDLVGP